MFRKHVGRAGGTERRIFSQPLHILNIHWEEKTEEGRGGEREEMEGVRKKEKGRRGREGGKGKGTGY